MDKSNVYQTYKSKRDYKLFTEMNKHEKSKLSNYLNSDNLSFSLTKSYIVYYIIFVVNLTNYHNLWLFYVNVGVLMLLYNHYE